jgi:hypothetical protein
MALPEDVTQVRHNALTPLCHTARALIRYQGNRSLLMRNAPRESLRRQRGREPRAGPHPLSKMGTFKTEARCNSFSTAACVRHSSANTVSRHLSDSFRVAFPQVLFFFR